MPPISSGVFLSIYAFDYQSGTVQGEIAPSIRAAIVPMQRARDTTMDMDFGTLMSAMLIGTFGLGFFVYGKKSQNLLVLGLGLALMIYPYFVHSVLWMWIIAVAVVAGAFALSKFSSSAV